MKLSLIISYIILGIAISTAVLGYIITTDKTRNCNTQVLENSFLNPMTRTCVEKTEQTTRSLKDWMLGSENYQKLVLSNEKPCSNQLTYILGTDRYGRDLISRIIIGMRFTLLVSLLSVIFACLIGISLGSIAAYYGGKTDQTVSFLINIFWALPTILLAFVILMSFGRNMTALFVSIGLTLWADIARLVRGQVLGLKEQNYIQSAKAMGFSDLRIIIGQILPNMAGPILIQASGNFALAVLLESGLSFLGMGLQAPIPTLGNILQDQYTQAFNGQILQSLIPAIVLVLLILSFQLLANHYRDKMDVKLVNR